MDVKKAFSLEGRVALITGAVYGIGFAIAEAYAAAGAKICFNCLSEEQRDKALEDYRAKGIDAHGYVADCTKEDEVQEMIARIEEEVGVVDILDPKRPGRPARRVPSRVDSQVHGQRTGPPRMGSLNSSQ